jgi:two-component system OmpR family sensor kinase
MAMARIESEAARMGVLVDELLLLARLDSGRPLEREPVDLAQLARDAAADFKAAAPNRPLDLDLCGPVVVTGDGDRLRQVLANLLANVRQHTPPDTPTRLTVRAEEDTAVIEVADDGPGLKAGEQALVFERFYRGDGSRTRASDSDTGAGLGLSIVAAVAAAHGGRADVRSQTGSGSVFAVRIPLQAVQAGSQTHSGSTATPQAR